MGEFKGTPGPWYPPHICDDSITCQCTSVVEPIWPGGICKIAVDNGLLISEGGNAAPPLNEAIANANLIAAAPDLLAALQEILEITDRDHCAWDRARAAIERATK